MCFYELCIEWEWISRELEDWCLKRCHDNAHASVHSITYMCISTPRWIHMCMYFYMLVCVYVFMCYGLRIIWERIPRELEDGCLKRRHDNAHALVFKINKIHVYLHLYLNKCMYAQMYVCVCVFLYVLCNIWEWIPRQLEEGFLQRRRYRVVKTHRMPDLRRSFSAKEPDN